MTTAFFIVLLIALAPLIALLVLGICHSAGMADRKYKILSGRASSEALPLVSIAHQATPTTTFSGGQTIPAYPCSWCQMEQNIKAHPHESHGICERHKREMIEQAKRFPKSQFA